MHVCTSGRILEEPYGAPSSQPYWWLQNPKNWSFWWAPEAWGIEINRREPGGVSKEVYPTRRRSFRRRTVGWSELCEPTCCRGSASKSCPATSLSSFHALITTHVAGSRWRNAGWPAGLFAISILTPPGPCNFWCSLSLRKSSKRPIFRIWKPSGRPKRWSSVRFLKNPPRSAYMHARI